MERIVSVIFFKSTNPTLLLFFFETVLLRLQNNPKTIFFVKRNYESERKEENTRIKRVVKLWII